jgi:hypothetical protein
MRTNKAHILVVTLIILVAFPQCSPSQVERDLPATAAPETAPTELKPFSRTEMQVPKFGSQGATQCDDDGNVYFLIPNQVNHTALVLSISSLSGSRKSFFPLPSELQKPGMESFFVTPSGTVYLLYQSGGAVDTYLASYTQNGGLTSTSRLAVPPNVVVEGFAASDDDSSVLVSGHYNQDVPAPLKNSPFIVVFDRSRTNFRTVVGIDPAELTVVPSGWPEQAVASGRDGMFYLLTPQHVIVINQAGQKIREIAIKRPTRDANVWMIKNSGGKILVAFFSEAPAMHRPDLLSEVLDRQTGQVLGTFSSSSFSNVLLCFDEQRGFTFLQGIDGKPFFVRAQIP